MKKNGFLLFSPLFSCRVIFDGMARLPQRVLRAVSFLVICGKEDQNPFLSHHREGWSGFLQSHLHPLGTAFCPVTSLTVHARQHRQLAALSARVAARHPAEKGAQQGPDLIRVRLCMSVSQYQRHSSSQSSCPKSRIGNSRAVLLLSRFPEHSFTGKAVFYRNSQQQKVKVKSSPINNDKCRFYHHFSREFMNSSKLIRIFQIKMDFLKIGDLIIEFFQNFFLEIQIMDPKQKLGPTFC